jgi:hypothetical protein
MGAPNKTCLQIEEFQNKIETDKYKTRKRSIRN